jgi:hypothetical protein
MGGHGGLNILPQKKWNVYNWDNRIKVMQNEKKVQDEIDKRQVEKESRKIKNKIKAIKNDEIEETNFYAYEEQNKNKIFKEIMQRESILQRVDNDLAIEKLRTPMKKNERLVLFEDEKLIKKLEGAEEDEPVEKNFTFKDSLCKNLQPWYLKKKKEDYAIYREFGMKGESEDKLLNKKRDKAKKKHKKHKKDKKDKKDKKPKNEIEEFALKLKMEKEKVLRKALLNKN